MDGEGGDIYTKFWYVRCEVSEEQKDWDEADECCEGVEEIWDSADMNIQYWLWESSMIAEQPTHRQLKNQYTKVYMAL